MDFRLFQPFVMYAQVLCASLFLWLRFAFHLGALFLFYVLSFNSRDRWNRSTDFLSSLPLVVMAMGGKHIATWIHLGRRE